jgi:hypothetical protein
MPFTHTSNLAAEVPNNNIRLSNALCYSQFICIVLIQQNGNMDISIILQKSSPGRIRLLIEFIQNWWFKKKTIPEDENYFLID